MLLEEFTQLFKIDWANGAIIRTKFIKMNFLYAQIYLYIIQCLTDAIFRFFFISRYMVVAKAIIYYFLPLLIIGVLYALMARRLHLSAREMPGELAGPQSRMQARARRHVARMVVTFVIGK